MVLVVKTRIGRQHVHEEPLDIPVGRPSPENPVPFEDSPGVGVDHEEGPFAGIEQDAVGRLLPDPRNGQKPPPRFEEIPGKHRGQVTPEVLAQRREKGFQPLCLDPEESRRTNQFLQVSVIETEQDERFHGFPGLDPPDGFLHVRPIRVLRQDRPDGNLEGRVPRPPVKRTEGPVQRPVHAD